LGFSSARAWRCRRERRGRPRPLRSDASPRLRLTPPEMLSSISTAQWPSFSIVRPSSAHASSTDCSGGRRQRVCLVGSGFLGRFALCARQRPSRPLRALPARQRPSRPRRARPCGLLGGGLLGRFALCSTASRSAASRDLQTAAFSCAASAAGSCRRGRFVFRFEARDSLLSFAEPSIGGSGKERAPPRGRALVH
jgi:hypothetical protein